MRMEMRGETGRLLGAVALGLRSAGMLVVMLPCALDNGWRLMIWARFDVVCVIPRGCFWPYVFVSTRKHWISDRCIEATYL